MRVFGVVGPLPDLLVFATTARLEIKKYKKKKEEPEKEVVAADPVEDVDDDLVGGAFAAKERSRIGDYDFAEHPLEKRANEAFQNDCKVPPRDNGSPPPVCELLRHLVMV